MRKKSKSSPYKQDPFYKREAEKYDTPIPSREWILQTLSDAGRPLTRNQLIKAIQLENEKEEVFVFRLRAMLRDGQLMQDRRGRYCLFDRINLRRGTIQSHPDGFGFFIPEDGSQDMVLSAREMRPVMHGDIVMVYQTGMDRRGRPEGKVHEVIEHAHTTVVGRFFSEHGVSFVTPDNKRLTQDISIPPEFTLDAKNGQVVMIELLSYPGKHQQAIGKVIQIVGEHMAPGMEIEVAILSHGIPATWPDNLLIDVARIPQHVSEEDTIGRADLRHLPFVTIDGEDAKDFDDAVYCYKKPRGGFQLYVAIADVSHYVKPGTALDAEAARRGNSTYFPGQVVPMLPEALSHGICSLNPSVDRLCMVAEISISTAGKLTRSRFYRAVIHSRARLTYTQVHQWFVRQQVDATHETLWPMLQELYELYDILHKTRSQRGALDFDTTETRIDFDKNRKIKQILPVYRNDAHRLIEECMLAANVATAKYLSKANIPALYRVHMPPADDKVTALREFLGELGLTLGGGDTPSPKDFQRTLNAASERPEKHLIETVMLRSLKQAQYTEDNHGHFGLAYPAYTHFTSPIRRYPDLLVHRAIGHLIDHQDNTTGFDYDLEDMNTYGQRCSITERRSDEATRDVVSWLKCEYMQDKLGQEFTGRISSVTSFGLFVELDDIFVEGLVHVTSLKSDYYTFDAVKHRLLGARTNTTFHLGDPMKIMVARVDLEERKIDFEPIEE